MIIMRCLPLAAISFWLLICCPKRCKSTFGAHARIRDPSDGMEVKIITMGDRSVTMPAKEFRELIDEWENDPKTDVRTGRLAVKQRMILQNHALLSKVQLVEAKKGPKYPPEHYNVFFAGNGRVPMTFNNLDHSNVVDKTHIQGPESLARAVDAAYRHNHAPGQTVRPDEYSFNDGRNLYRMIVGLPGKRAPIIEQRPGNLHVVDGWNYQEVEKHLKPIFDGKEPAVMTVAEARQHMVDAAKKQSRFLYHPNAVSESIFGYALSAGRPPEQLEHTNPQEVDAFVNGLGGYRPKTMPELVRGLMREGKWKYKFGMMEKERVRNSWLEVAERPNKQPLRRNSWHGQEKAVPEKDYDRVDRHRSVPNLATPIQESLAEGFPGSGLPRRRLQSPAHTSAAASSSARLGQTPQTPNVVEGGGKKKKPSIWGRIKKMGR